MPNKITARMPSKTQYIMKYGNRWYYEWDKARKEYNRMMGISMIDWVESKISKYKTYRFGIKTNQLVRTNIYAGSWQQPEIIQFNELPADLKYHDKFEQFKSLNLRH